MTIMNANTLNDQVDYLSPKGQSFAEQTLNSVFNEAPRNAVDDDDEDDSDETLPDPDDDLLDDDDDTFPNELDTTDDDDDDVIDDEDDLEDDDDTGSTTAGLNNPPTGGFGAQSRTTGRMTDHEPGSINNNDL